MIRIQNLRKFGERPTHGLNAGGINYGNYASPDPSCPPSGVVLPDGTCNSAWCFEMFLQEPDCLDAWHTMEAVDWLVIEEGAYYTKEGAMMQAGVKAVQGGGWEDAHFHMAFPEEAAAAGLVVLSQLQTTNDVKFAKTRQQAVDRETFQIAVEQIGGTMDMSHRHGLETAGWLALEAGSGMLGETQYEAGLLTGATEVASQVAFTRPFATKPEVFGSIASWHGADAVQLRQDGLNPNPVTTTTMSFALEEEGCVDNEAAGAGSVANGAGGNCVAGAGAEYIPGNGCHPGGEDVAWLALGNAWTLAGDQTPDPAGGGGGGDPQVCFGAGGDDLGDDNYAEFSLPIDAHAIKLVYQSGGVSCNYAGRGKYTKWGCDEDQTSSMSVFLTTNAHGGASTLNDVVAPARAHIVSDNLWYNPFDNNWSQGNELTFSGGAQTAPGQTFTGQVGGSYPAGRYLIWFGEDLGDRSQHDNGGATCATVYYLRAPLRSTTQQNVAQQMQHAEMDMVGMTNQIIRAVHVPQPLQRIGEMGTVALNTNWITVVLDNDHYERPVVFCSIPSRGGADPVVCRINRLRYAPTVTRYSAADGSQETTGCGGCKYMNNPRCCLWFHECVCVYVVLLVQGALRLPCKSRRARTNGMPTRRYHGLSWRKAVSSVMMVHSCRLA